MASPSFALGSERFTALLAFLLPLAPQLRSLARRLCQVIAAGGRARFDAKNTLTTQHFDGDPLPLDPLRYLCCPAHVVALLRARDLRRLTFAQVFNQRFPIDVVIFILSI